MELAGKIALVTGAGSGIGRVTALKMAEAGADIAVLSYDKTEVEAVSAEIEKLGRKVLPLVADVSDDAQMKAAFAHTKETFGHLDILFANAGINGVWTSIENFDVKDWDRVHAVNLRGMFLSVHYAIPLMRAAGSGSIVITSSINGTKAFSYVGATAYGATKMGQISFTKTAALELAQYKIRVNAVCPGGIKTNIELATVKRGLDEVEFPIEYPKGQIPLLNEGELGDPEEVAELVLFLASDRARHITGTPIYIDGGQSLVS